jgi:uncharacterized membrane protein
MRRLITCLALLTILTPGLLIIQPARAESILAATAASSSVDVLNNTSGPCNNPDASSNPSICGDDSTNSNKNPVFGQSGIVTVVVRILSLVVGFLAVVFIIVQAIKLSASGGDPQAVSSARSGIMYALIGLVVAILAQVLVDFVLSNIT